MPQRLAMIVEEDHRLGETLVDLLELLELRCVLCKNKEDVQEQLTRPKPDIVLLDLPFYKQIGLDILTRIRGDLRFRDTKIIVIIGEQPRDTAELELADAVLLKPFSFDLLEETIRSLLNGLHSSDSGKFESLGIYNS